MNVPAVWKAVVASLCSCVAGGCFSTSLPRLAREQKDVLAQPFMSNRKVRIAGCQDGISGALCDQDVRLFAVLLRESMLFSSVTDTSGSDQDADLILQIIDVPRRPYYTEPSHNPGFVLLSIALPFWWSEEYGYRLSGQCARTGETLNVDTTREGTGVMWSLAPVLNLSPDRGFRENPRREASQILLHLQPLLERCAVEPKLPAIEPEKAQR